MSPPRSATYTPDYQALIQQDPAFMAVSQHLSAKGISERAQRGADTAKALIQYGIVPDFDSLGASLGLSSEEIAMLKEDIDPHTGDLARQNTGSGLSTTARLAEGQRQAILSLRNWLAARGALGSGDNAYRTNIQDTLYAGQSSDALNSVLASIGGYQSNYNTAQQNDQSELDAARTTAWQFEAGLPQNQGFQLTYDAKHGVYRDASGNTYTPHKNDDGTWRLTGSTGSVYTLGANGQLTSGIAPPAPPPAGWTPDPTPPPPGPTPGWTPDPTAPPTGGWTPDPGTLPSPPPGGAIPLTPPLGGYPVQSGGGQMIPAPPLGGGFGFPGSGNNPQIPGAFGGGQPPHPGGGFGWNPQPTPGSPAWYGRHPGRNPLGPPKSPLPTPAI